MTLVVQFYLKNGLIDNIIRAVELLRSQNGEKLM